MSSKDSQHTTQPSSGYYPKRHNLIMACNRLRLDRNDRTAVEEYRIESGSVERRILSALGCPAPNSPWQRLSPDQIASHVLASTVVAHWLQRRMGTLALIQACNQHSVRHAGQGPRSSPQIVTAEVGPLLPNPAQSDGGNPQTPETPLLRARTTNDAAEDRVHTRETTNDL